MSEKLTARERYEADKARLAAQREANNAKYAAQREAQKAAREKIGADYHAKTAEADERLHDDIDKSKAELKQTWAEYASDRRARKEAEASSERLQAGIKKEPPGPPPHKGEANQGVRAVQMVWN